MIYYSIGTIEGLPSHQSDPCGKLNHKWLLFSPNYTSLSFLLGFRVGFQDFVKLQENVKIEQKVPSKNIKLLQESNFLFIEDLKQEYSWTVRFLFPSDLVAINLHVLNRIFS